MASVTEVVAPPELPAATKRRKAPMGNLGCVFFFLGGSLPGEMIQFD